MESIIYLVGVAVAGFIGNYVTTEHRVALKHVERQNPNHAVAVFINRAFRSRGDGPRGG
jgi:hypothetical protein